MSNFDLSAWIYEMHDSNDLAAPLLSFKLKHLNFAPIQEVELNEIDRCQNLNRVTSHGARFTMMGNCSV